jgi:hypothetical protein
MGYLYPLIAAGVADSAQQAIDRHFEIYGFEPVHPSKGEWIWRDSYLESTEFGTVLRPVQPAYEKGDRNFGLFPEAARIGVNMQLEDTGLAFCIAPCNHPRKKSIGRRDPRKPRAITFKR